MPTIALPAQYKIIKKLGQGGMSDIFLAEKTGSYGFIKRCVIKTPQHLNPTPAVLAAFVDEARLLAELRHPNIIEIFDLIEFQGKPFLVLEHIDGHSLKDLLEHNSDGLTTDKAIKIARQVLKGLDYFHNFINFHGKKFSAIHRDLTPSNLLIAQSGEVKICDFGVSKSAISQTNTQMGTIKGKWRYLAPEMIEERNLDHRSDLFIFALSFWEMLHGRPFFQDQTPYLLLNSIQKGKYDFSSNVDLPDGLMRIFKKALDPSPLNRFASAKEFLRAIDILQQPKTSKLHSSSNAKRRLTTRDHQKDTPPKASLVTKTLLLAFTFPLWALVKLFRSIHGAVNREQQASLFRSSKGGATHIFRQSGSS